MATFTKFHYFVRDLAEKKHDLKNDTLKIALTLSAPDPATDEQLMDITEIASNNGYTAGGNPAAISSAIPTAGTYKLVLYSPGAWTATGGAMADFRYAVLYNSTPITKNLIGFWDNGSTVSLSSGQTFSITLDESNGVLTIT